MITYHLRFLQDIIRDPRIKIIGLESCVSMEAVGRTSILFKTQGIAGYQAPEMLTGMDPPRYWLTSKLMLHKGWVGGLGLTCFH